MDKPPPDDLDPALIDEQAYRLNDDSDDDEQYTDQSGNPEPAQDRPQRPRRGRAHKGTQLSHETSMLKDIFEFLIPPKDDSPENIRRWRIAIGLISSISCLHLLSAAGTFEIIGFSGFARASDVVAINAEIQEARIFEARLRQCTASTQESRQFYAKQVQELLGRVNWSKGHYRLPACDEIR
jgi:hypothetical protein